MIRLVCVLIGYVFGLFQTSYLYGRLNGIDIRDHGSGNAGTTNALRTLGKKAGAITFLGDCFKCVFAVLLVRILFCGEFSGTSFWSLLFGSFGTGQRMLLGMYATLGVILGHNFPFYLHFKGGKGIAATAGLFVILDPVLMVIALVSFVGSVAITRYVSLGSIIVVVEMMIGVVIYGVQGKWHLEAAGLYEVYAITAFLMIMAIYRHRANIKRLMSGTERKIGERAE